MNKSEEQDLLREIVGKLIDEYITSVNDLRSQKNNTMAQMENQFNSLIFHNQGVSEWTREFGEQLDSLSQQLNRLEKVQNDRLLTIEHRYKNQTATLQQLVNLITDMYESIKKNG